MKVYKNKKSSGVVSDHRHTLQPANHAHPIGAAQLQTESPDRNTLSQPKHPRLLLRGSLPQAQNELLQHLHPHHSRPTPHQPRRSSEIKFHPGTDTR